jgi:lipopolysaccharide cholinephosphotransferase
LYNVPGNKFLQKIQYYEAALLKAKAVQVYGYHTDSIKKKIQLFFANILVNRITKNLIYRDVCKYSKKDTQLVGHFFGRAKFNKSIYRKEWFKNQRYVDFETVNLPVPNGVEDYLITRYGKDYMKMPSEDTKKEYQTHAAIWSVDTDYKDYKRKMKNNEKI